ncbi:copia protein [Tanacetum coccineum]
MITKPQVFYDNNLKQALGFQNPFYLMKAQQIRPMLYDGSVIAKETNVDQLLSSEETLMLEEESQSKMFLKQNFGIRFVLQQELSDEQALRLQTLHPNTDQSASSPVKIEAPRELPKNNTSVNQTEPSFDQLFELNNLKAELQAKDTTIQKLKANIKRLNKTSNTNSVKKDIDEIETINIELEHRVTKLIAENEHLKQTYKQLYDSIQPSRVQAKEHTEYLVTQLNQKSVEITDLNAQLQEKVFVLTTFKNDLRKYKGKDIVDNAAQASNATTIALGMYKLDPIVEQSKSLNPLDSASYSACNSMFDARHEFCFIEFISDMNASSKSKSIKKAKKKEEWKPTGKVFTKIVYNWRPTEKTFTLDGNTCPLTKITTTNKVPLKEPIPLKVVAQEYVVTKVYTRRPKVPKTNGSNSKPKIAKSVISNKTKPGTSWGSNTLVAPSSSSSVDLRKPDLSYLYVFGAHFYPNSDSENLGKFQAKADIGPRLQSLNPATSSSVLVSNLILQQPFLVANAPRAIDLANSLVSLSIDQDALSTKSPKTPHFHDDPLHEYLHEDSTSQGSLSNVRLIQTAFESLGRWNKDHPIENVIEDPSRSVFTKKQLQTDAMKKFLNLKGYKFRNWCRDNPSHVYKLKKALYGLKQAPRAWYDMLSSFLFSQHFSKGVVDPTLFRQKAGNDLLLVQIYVDDIIFASTNTAMCNEFANLMTTKFKMSMMGQMSFFLGLQISQSPRGIFLNQSKYASEIIKKYDMLTSDSVDTPMVEKSKLDEDIQWK